MVTDTEQLQFNFTIICEGLNSIACSSDEQLKLNKKGLTHLDAVFDPMPMDYLSWLEDKNEITPEFAFKLRNLYEHIESTVREKKEKRVSTL
ncbi:MAG: hypothetical protein KZQ90_17190 [Candidatus Thiodiazotropha sp. (ex Codakia rugifera)]|nr:hypothetical protein [Candidatus Thiodiazotropha sp. (ex Codakia rugifera)]